MQTDLTEFQPPPSPSHAQLCGTKVSLMPLSVPAHGEQLFALDNDEWILGLDVIRGAVPA